MPNPAEREAVFFDTNVVLRLLSSDARKADRAERLLASGGHVSVQVLNETASVCSRKLRMPWPEIGELLGAVRASCTVHPLTVETHALAVAIAARSRLSLYDACICASAARAGVAVLLTEDPHAGQVIEGVRLVDPFD